MRRTIVACAATALLLAAVAGAESAPAPLIGSTMLGTYSCAGKDVRGKPVSGQIGWTYADGDELMFWAHLKPKQPVTFIDEGWDLESPETGWVTNPNPDSLDTAMYRSGGWKNKKLSWQRMAAQSTLARTFEKTSSGVTFAVTTAGAEAHRIGYTVRCKRVSRT